MIIPERHRIHANKAFSSYWKVSKNNLLPGLLPENHDMRDADKWVKYYFAIDDLGDAVASQYLLKHGFSDGLNMLLNHFNQYPKNRKNLSIEATNLFKQFNDIPLWVNFELINEGARYCNRCGTSSLSVLRNYCLMGGYESAAINKPLIFTEALKKGAVKRLSDTVDFWMHVTEIDGLKPHHQGIISILMTRMIHSFSRMMIEKNTTWKSALWGRPLNTWDMVATNLGFSIAFIDGLSKLNLPPTSDEMKGTLHLWKYAGYLLGIPDSLLPDTPQEAAYRLYLWSKSQTSVDKDSKALAYALYEEPRKVSFTNSIVMKWFVQKTNLGYNEVLLGSESRSALGLPYSKAVYWILSLNKINKVMDSKAKHSNSFYKKMVRKGRKAQQNVWKLYRSERH